MQSDKLMFTYLLNTKTVYSHIMQLRQPHTLVKTTTYFLQCTGDYSGGMHIISELTAATVYTVEVEPELAPTITAATAAFYVSVVK